MTTISQRLSHLNPFSTKNIGFLDVWLKKYYSEKEWKLMSDKLNQFICFYFIFLTIRSTIALIFRLDNVLGERLSVYLGSWSVLLGGPPHYFEFIAILWDIQSVGTYLTIFCKPKDQFLWIDLFGAINGYVDYNSVGIDDKMLNR